MFDKPTSSVLNSVKTENCSTIGSLDSKVCRKSCMSCWFSTKPRGFPKHRCEMMSVVKYWMFLPMSHLLVCPELETQSLSMMRIHSSTRASMAASTPSTSLPVYYQTLDRYHQNGLLGMPLPQKPFVDEACYACECPSP